jgi:hypothetical protein
MELEVFFTIIQQTYSKLVISFMNRKSSCGSATHFFSFDLSCSLVVLKSFRYYFCFPFKSIKTENMTRKKICPTKFQNKISGADGGFQEPSS